MHDIDRVISVTVAGDGEDFMNIALREGGVVVAINLGSGIFETDVKPHRGTVRFDDNQWHRLAITREAREVSVTMSVRFLLITVIILV